MLFEMRKLDRDREKIIHPATIENLVHKYKVPITPCIDSLLDKYENKTFGGLVNYEDLMQYLQDSRQRGSTSNIQEYLDHNDNKQRRDQTVTIKKGRRDHRRASSADAFQTKNSSQIKPSNEDKNSDLVRELSISLEGQSKEVRFHNKWLLSSPSPVQNPGPKSKIQVQRKGTRIGADTIIL